MCEIEAVFIDEPEAIPAAIWTGRHHGLNFAPVAIMASTQMYIMATFSLPYQKSQINHLDPEYMPLISLANRFRTESMRWAPDVDSFSVHCTLNNPSNLLHSMHWIWINQRKTSNAREKLDTREMPCFSRELESSEMDAKSIHVLGISIV